MSAYALYGLARCFFVVVEIYYVFADVYGGPRVEVPRVGRCSEHEIVGRAVVGYPYRSENLAWGFGHAAVFAWGCVRASGFGNICAVRKGTGRLARRAHCLLDARALFVGGGWRAALVLLVAAPAAIEACDARVVTRTTREKGSVRCLTALLQTAVLLKDARNELGGVEFGGLPLRGWQKIGRVDRADECVPRVW